jgi:hypothetical protein
MNSDAYPEHYDANKNTLVYLDDNEQIVDVRSTFETTPAQLVS